MSDVVGSTLAGYIGGMSNMIWHSQDINSVLRELDTDPNTGLTSEEAERRLREHGTNEVAKAQNKAITEFLPHFFNQI